MPQLAMDAAVFGPIVADVIASPTGCYLDDGATAVACGAYPVKVVDTTGAGDAWFGRLLTALHRGMVLEQAGRFANRVAADC